jgi:MscS family membrane protein
LNIDIGTLLAGLGIGGFAVAIALKSALSDIFSGLALMMSKPFKKGDIVRIQGENCKVEKIGLKYTFFRNHLYNYQHIVPNTKIIEDQIVNISAHSGAFVITKIKLSFQNKEEQLTKAFDLIKEAVNENKRAKFDFIKHDYFDDYSSVIKLSYDVDEFKNRHIVETEISSTIIKKFQENNIKFLSLPVFIQEKE